VKRGFTLIELAVTIMVLAIAAAFVAQRDCVFERPHVQQTELVGELEIVGQLVGPRVVIAAPQVPIGAYTAEILAGAYRKYGPEFQKKVEARIASTELNVRQVLAKVELGEADAGVVYRTDIASARTAIAAVSIPPELNVRAEYPIAVLKGSRHPELAAAWIELLTSSAGRTVLGELGFLPPTDDARKRP